MTKTNKVKTWLISGAGNTFHVLDSSSVNKFQRSSFVVDLCKKVPADGVVFLKKVDSQAGAPTHLPTDLPVYKWYFYNNDGSIAEMCGNAARCVGHYVSQKYHDTRIVLQTLAGDVAIEELAPRLYKVKMTPFKIFKHSRFFYCNTGVPHIIYPLDKFETYSDHLDEARLLRNHADFKPQGVNVTFIGYTSDPLTFKAVSYERGVEDFTPACGTGAMAVALYNWVKYGYAKTAVIMPGGNLTLDLTDVKNPIMIGPAQILKEYTDE